MMFQKLPGPFGASCTGVDLARDTSDETLRALAGRLFEDHILVLPAQHLAHDDYVKFGSRWGRPVLLIQKSNRMASHPEMIPQSNSPATSAIVRNAASHWHCDSSYEAEAATVTMLYGVIAPDAGGETLFADLGAAYDALDAAMKARIEPLQVRHGAGRGTPEPDEVIVRPDALTEEQRKTLVELPPAVHPLVRRHPVTGRKHLYGVGGTPFEIIGVAPAEGQRLLQTLKLHATEKRFVQSYKLLPNDVLLWDNFSVMHRATPITYTDKPGETRLNYRISVKGLPAFLPVPS